MVDNQAKKLDAMIKNESRTRYVAVTSGKGGVGKSTISANLSYKLSRMNFRVGVFDADIGLANLDLILGVKTDKNILHVLKGEASINDVVYPIDHNLYLIPGDSGEEILKYASGKVIENFIQESSILDTLDFIIIDTGAGIGTINQTVLKASEHMVVVTMPDPSAITDAYATIKVNASSRDRILMIVNMCKSQKEALAVFDRMQNIAKKNINNLELKYLGGLENSQAVNRATRNRALISKTEPLNVFSNSLSEIARSLVADVMAVERNMLSESKGFKSFFKRMLGYL